MVAGANLDARSRCFYIVWKAFFFPRKVSAQLQLRPARMRVVALVRCGWEPGWLPGPASICDLPRSRAREQQLRVRRGRAGHRDACTASGPWPLRNTCSPRRLAQRGEGLLLQHGHLRALRAPGGAGAGHWYSALQARTRPVWPNPGGTLPPQQASSGPSNQDCFPSLSRFPDREQERGRPAANPTPPNLAHTTPPPCTPQVVALANLLPQEVEADDLDSYMYQTVGHQVIAAYAQCMGLPLFRRRIRGSARQQVGAGGARSAWPGRL